MEMYERVQYENGDILLKKFVVDISKYNIVVQSDGDKLLVKKKNIVINSINLLKNYNFAHGKITSCSINGVEQNQLKFKKILGEVYNLINNGVAIIKKSTLNIKTIKKTDEGFSFIKNLGISVQGCDSNKCINEIFIQAKANNIKVYMEVELENKTMLTIDI